MRLANGQVGRLCTIVAVLSCFVPATIAGGTAKAGSTTTTHVSDGAAVVVLGDSITADNVDLIRTSLDRHGHTSVRYAALGARRIEVSSEFFGWRNSGLDEVRSLQEDGVDPELWIVELGTNDLPSILACACDDPVEFAGRLIDLLLETIGPGEQVAWATLLNRHDPAPTRAFNTALRRRAAASPTLQLIDWHRIAVDKPHWFIDHVHPNRLGALMLARLYRQVLQIDTSSQAPSRAPRITHATAHR